MRLPDRQGAARETRVRARRPGTGDAARRRRLAGPLPGVSDVLAGPGETGDRLQGRRAASREAAVFLHRPDHDGDRLVAEATADARRDLQVHHGPVPLLQGEPAGLAEQHPAQSQPERLLREGAAGPDERGRRRGPHGREGQLLDPGPVRQRDVRARQLQAQEDEAAAGARPGQTGARGITGTAFTLRSGGILRDYLSGSPRDATVPRMPPKDFILRRIFEAASLTAAFLITLRGFGCRCRPSSCPTRRDVKRNDAGSLRRKIPSVQIPRDVSPK